MKIRRQLSAREKQIAVKVVEGYTSRQIADHYDISVHTVRNHRKNIMKRFNITKAVQMVKLLKRDTG
jgi:DNA-binding CsgD family transcriptional regulator